MRFSHATIQTVKFEEEIKFFQEHVGLKITADFRGKGMNIVFLSDKEGDTAIEIINNPNAASSGNENFSIGFDTADLESKRDELIKEGFKVTDITSPAPNVQFFFVTDHAGVTVQFKSA